MEAQKKLSLIIIILCTLAAIAFALYYPLRKHSHKLNFLVYEANKNTYNEVGEILHFEILDSSIVKENDIVWHFGNGDFVKNKFNVEYKYSEEGKYLVTMKINGNQEVSKYVDVVRNNIGTSMDTVPKIYCVGQGYEGEELVFFAESPNATEWTWEFGESGLVDAYDQQVIYIYKTPGTYRIKLNTDVSEYPVYKTINILPLFEKIAEIVAIDELALAENDIKERLQKIANANVDNANAFYQHFNYLKNTYLCGNADKVVVVINGDKYNDFASYCQGLHYLRGSKTKRIAIESVSIDTTKCFERMDVTQMMIEQ